MEQKKTGETRGEREEGVGWEGEEGLLSCGSPFSAFLCQTVTGQKKSNHHPLFSIFSNNFKQHFYVNG